MHSYVVITIPVESAREKGRLWQNKDTEKGGILSTYTDVKPNTFSSTRASFAAYTSMA